MSASLTSAIPLIIVGLVLLTLAVWLIMRRGQSTDVVGDDTIKRDVLDEGATPAQRNQALIDAAPAAVSNTFGDTSAVANTDTLAAAGASADAEAGASVAPTKAPVSPPAPEPTPEPTPTPTPSEPAPINTPEPPRGAADDLTTIKGIGPKLVTLLADLGVTRFAQIAAWSEADIAEIDAKLGRFKGRITRDQWVEQAKLLISDDKSAYAEKFGNK